MDLRLRRVLLALLPAGVVMGLIYSAIWGDNGLVRRLRMQEEVGRVERSLAHVRSENALLEREVGQLRGDETTVRRAIAEELLLVPAGSTVYRFE